MYESKRRRQFWVTGGGGQAVHDARFNPPGRKFWRLFMTPGLINLKVRVLKEVKRFMTHGLINLKVR